MGNETFRAARHSAGFGRSNSMRTKSNGGHAYITEDEVDRQPSDSLTAPPKPNRRIDKLRRSLTFRRKTKKPTESHKLESTPPPQSQPQLPPASTDTAASSSRPALWLDDEKRVRAGSCSFQVKYLGYQEVSDSRGMHICETALAKLIADKKKPLKAILYITGDSLRVVDESNKMLLVDQTIEKVSFCAPDRHHPNGFAYICRDGTARRWLCHGFLAAKDTLKNASGSCTGGERLSHAVGCAFSVCLERKQKRERENVSMQLGPNHSFTRLGSFRQASLTERFDDPQMVIPKVEPAPIKPVANPHAIQRPKAHSSLGRQNSLREAPFKRGQPAYQSLKPAELPSFQQQKLGFSQSNGDHIPSSKTLAELAKISEVPEAAAAEPAGSELSEHFSQELSFGSPTAPAPMQTSSSVFVTPVTPSMPPPPLPPLPLALQSSSSPMSANQTVCPSRKGPETFEQKWARIQAAKNTNPFAEDIAKKYEIKL